MKKFLLTISFLGLLVSAHAADTSDAPAKKRPGLNAVPQIPEVDGVTKEEIEKFKAAYLKSNTDENVKAARAKLQDFRSRMQYASADEKKDLRTEGQGLAEELRKALRAAIAKNDSTLKKDTIDKIADAIEDNLKAKAKENAPKAAAKMPTKPFPFGDKAKTDDSKTPAATDTK